MLPHFDVTEQNYSSSPKWDDWRPYSSPQCAQLFSCLHFFSFFKLERRTSRDTSFLMSKLNETLSIHCQRGMKSKLNVQNKCRNKDIEMKKKKKDGSTLQNQTKNLVCLAKKKVVHSFPCQQDHTQPLPQTVSQITEPAVFTLIFYLYVCTDVRYWRGGVPINLWSPTPQVYKLCIVLDMDSYSEKGLVIKEDYLIRLEG